MALGEPIAHFRAGQFRAEGFGVHTALPEVGAIDALGGEGFDHGGGGAEIELGLVVDGFEEVPEERFEGGEFVVLEVGGEVGVIGGEEGELPLTGVVDPGEADDGGVYHMDQIGVEGFEGFADRGPGKGEFEFGVEREGEAGDADDRDVVIFGEAVVGAEDLDGVALAVEVGDGVFEAGNDAVDFGEVGFGEESDSHRLYP
ncbi:MAG: hypothetical protein RLZZ511_682 [Cyanobacteriota bacterium]